MQYWKKNLTSVIPDVYLVYQFWIYFVCYPIYLEAQLLTLLRHRVCAVCLHEIRGRSNRCPVCLGSSGAERLRSVDCWVSFLILNSRMVCFFVVCFVGKTYIRYGKIYRTLSNLTESVKHQEYTTYLCFCLCVCISSFRGGIKKPWFTSWRGGGACYVLNHPSSKGITCQGRDPIRRVVRLYNWANPASQWFAVFGTRKLDKNQGVTGAGQGIAQDFIKLWEIKDDW